VRTSAAVLLALIVALAPAQGQAPSAWRAEALAAFDEVWHTIDETYFDPSFGGMSWSGVRAELRPKAEQATSADAVREVIIEMLARLGQSHFSLLTSSAVGDPMPGNALVPIEIRVVNEGALVTRVEDPGLARVIRPGDVLVSVDGQDPLAEAEGRDDRARRLDGWRRITRALHGREGSMARLVIRRHGGDVDQLDVARTAGAGDVVQLGNLPALRVNTTVHELRSPARQRVGLIRFNVWMIAVAEPFAEAIETFRSADGLVIDLRGNPGGLADMMRGIAGHLIDQPDLIGTMQMRSAVLEFRANPRRSTPDGRRVSPFGGRLAILVDELTASASECFAGGLQDLGRARIFGAQTMGQALPAATKRLANGDVLLYAIGDFVTSTGRRLEGRGVVPDEAAPLVPAQIAAGRDPALDRALAWIDSER
jgi:carboxyl-terminal processing protease